MGSATIYADDYITSSSSVSSSTTKDSSHRLNQSNDSKCVLQQASATPTKFNERLRRLYHTFNKTISLSSNVIASPSGSMNDKKLDMEDVETTPCRNMNEYSTVVSGRGECEMKVESDGDRLRLFRPSTPVRKSSVENTYVVSTPVQVSNNGSVVGSSESSLNPGQLNIYEVDFDNDVAYIVPTVTNVTCTNEDAEIYQVDYFLMIMMVLADFCIRN